MTISIGTKVQISDNYLAARHNPNESIIKVRGREGVVTDYLAEFVVVTPTGQTDKFWNAPFLFLEHELIVLEEAYGLTKESINS